MISKGLQLILDNSKSRRPILLFISGYFVNVNSVNRAPALCPRQLGESDDVSDSNPSRRQSWRASSVTVTGMDIKPLLVSTILAPR
jgi:hypothetical protein